MRATGKMLFKYSKNLDSKSQISRFNLLQRIFSTVLKFRQHHLFIHHYWKKGSRKNCPIM